MQIAYFWLDIQDGRYRVQTPYHKLFVLDLKTAIPGDSRIWDKDKKLWLVSPAYKGAMMAVLERYFEVRQHRQVEVMIRERVGDSIGSTNVGLARRRVKV